MPFIAVRLRAGRSGPSPVALRRRSTLGPPVFNDSSWPVSADVAVKWPDTRDQMSWVRRRVAAPSGITGPLAILWPDGCDATHKPAELFVNGVRVAAVGQMGPRRPVRIRMGSVWAEGYMVPEGSRGAVTAGLILNCLAEEPGISARLMVFALRSCSLFLVSAEVARAPISIREIRRSRETRGIAIALFSAAYALDTTSIWLCRSGMSAIACCKSR